MHAALRHTLTTIVLIAFLLGLTIDVILWTRAIRTERYNQTHPQTPTTQGIDTRYPPP